MNKKNLILGGIFAVLLIMLFFYEGPLKDWRESLGKPANFLANVDAQAIDRIEIGRSDQEIVLERQGEDWKMAGSKEMFVKEGLAGELNNKMKEATEAKFELASENGDKKEEFQTGENGTMVRLYSGENKAAEFVVGKMSVDYSATYVSLPESPETYAMKTDLNSIFNGDEWFDRTILDFEKEAASKIRFQYPTREFTIEKRDGRWVGTLPYNFRVSEDIVDEILDGLAGLNAAEIPAQTFEGTGLEKHLMIVQVTGDDLDHTIMVGENNGNDLFYAKNASSDNIYLISKEQRDLFDRTINDLR